MTETCLWTEDEDAVWHTSCGHTFEVNNMETPTENGFKFCCYCGRAIKEQGWDVAAAALEGKDNDEQLRRDMEDYGPETAGDA